MGSRAETCTSSLSPGTADCRFGRWDVHYCVGQGTNRWRWGSGAAGGRGGYFKQSEVRAPDAREGGGQNGDGDEMNSSVADGA